MNMKINRETRETREKILNPNNKSSFRVFRVFRGFKNVAFCIFISALALSGCSRKQTETIVTEVGLPVRVTKVESRTFENRIAVQGTIQAKNFANIAARVGGTLDDVFVDEGDIVEADKTALFQIDSTTLNNAWTVAEQQWKVAKASVEVANANLERTEAEAAKVARDFERFERLHKEGRVSDNEFEQREVQYQQSQAGLAVAKAQVVLANAQVEQTSAAVAIAQKNVEDSTGIAPVSGFVAARYREPGEFVGAGATVLRIEDPSFLEVAAFLPAQYYDNVIPGKTQARVVMQGSGGLRASEQRQDAVATISFRSPSINPVLRTFEIKGRVDSDKAVSGAMADVSIIFESRESMGVPSAAVLVRGGKNVVFVLNGNRAVQKEVTTGLANNHWTEILSGLSLGDTIVTEGQTLLNDGSLVNLLER